MPENEPTSIHGQQLKVWQDRKEQIWEINDKEVWERGMWVTDLSEEHSVIIFEPPCGSAQ